MSGDRFAHPVPGGVTLVVWLHAALVVAHGAAHAGADVHLSTAGSGFVAAIVVAAPIAGLAVYRSGLPRAGCVSIAASMGAAFCFGVLNHFLWNGADHVNAVSAGAWHITFRWTAVALAFSEAFGALAGLVAFTSIAPESRS